MDQSDLVSNFQNTVKLNCDHAKTYENDWLPKDYDSFVDESILKVDFTPDIFQKQAFYFLAKNESVFVSAHTSSGKTLVAEYAICKAHKNENRVIYTSPIKALSNQKFYDFKQKFGDTGLITGDVQVNPEAKCLIMTTEILRNFVYKNADILRDTEFVIFDEVHYINDKERGVVWEECIMMLTSHISLVLLSATIPNSLEFSQWVGRVTKRCVHVISTLKRAVPLEFAVYCDAEAYKIDDDTGKKETLTNFKEELSPFSKKTKIYNQFRVNDLGEFVKQKSLLPAIFFTFSRRGCEEYGKSLQNLDLTTDKEKESIEKFLNDAVKALNEEEERHLPQIRTMRQQLYRGIAVHHGALLPFVKECIEILFSENLVKILIATETFAMGVNMPAKCCVFLSVTKMDSGGFRYLNTAEFIQMSGRAGRRGMDAVGTVLIADQKMPPLTTIKRIISGTQSNLCSKFKLSFSLILMAIRSKISIKDLMRNSFRENTHQKNFGSDLDRLHELRNSKQLSCSECSDFLELISDIKLINRKNSPFIKNAARKGDICILMNNSIVKILQITQNSFKYSNHSGKLEGDLFQINLTEEQKALYKESKTQNLLKYPLTYRNVCENGVATFEEVFFLVKDSKIFVDYNEIPFQFLFDLKDVKNGLQRILKNKMLKCKNLLFHYLEAISSERLLEEKKYLEKKYLDSSLIQIDEFYSRVLFLEAKGYVENSSITLKGRAAAEIRTVNEILIVEMIFNNEFENFSSQEILAIFSSMICEDKNEGTEIQEALSLKVAVLERYFHEISNEITNKYSFPDMAPLNHSSVQAVFDWCNGHSLGSIVCNHGIPEGTFVRLILRIDECCREILNICALISDKNLEEKIQKGAEMIRRDIIFLPSLYI